MADFITNGATELPAVGDDGKVRAAVNWTVGDTYDIQQALLDLRSVATGWDDLLGDISQGTANQALTYEAVRDTAFLAYFFRNNQLDSLSMRFQMPHAWDSSVAPVPHLHVAPMVAPSSSPQNVHLSGYWAWIDSSNAIPALTGWTAWAADLSIATADAFKTFYVNVDNVTVPVGLKGSAILLVYLQRNGGAGTDTYTTNKSGGTTAANLALISFDCHVKKVRTGSPTPTPI